MKKTTTKKIKFYQFIEFLYFDKSETIDQMLRKATYETKVCFAHSFFIEIILRHFFLFGLIREFILVQKEDQRN